MIQWWQELYFQYFLIWKIIKDLRKPLEIRNRLTYLIENTLFYQLPPFNNVILTL